MKRFYGLALTLSISSFILIFSACKKDDNTPANNSSTNNNNNNNPCNFTTNVLVINATTKNILSDSCRVFGNNYFSEHWVDAAKTEGIVLIFNGTTPPAAGTYTAVSTFPAIDATHTYVEYYTSANAYQPASGTITVTDNGSSKVYTFCNFTCSSGSANKTVSVRATCN
jgi:hypothetical protein